MTMASTTTQELQDQFLAIIRKSQEIALDALKTTVETVQNITPKIPTIDVPFADKLPKPQDVVASGYEFAAKLLASQPKFANEVVQTTAAMLPGTAESTSAPGPRTQSPSRPPGSATT